MSCKNVAPMLFRAQKCLNFGLPLFSSYGVIKIDNRFLEVEKRIVTNRIPDSVSNLSLGFSDKK